MVTNKNAPEKKSNVQKESNALEEIKRNERV